MAQLDDRARLAQLDDLVAATEKPDPKLDGLVRATATAAGTPVALVSLVVQHAQLFRAEFGLPPDLAASRGTSRCDSFCQIVVQTEQPLIVSDAERDPRVPRALVERYASKAYLGHPLFLRGAVVGSLCALDTSPRPFTADQIESVAAFATEVSKRFEQLTEKAERRRVRATMEVLRSVADLRDQASALGRLSGEVAPIVRLVQAFRDGVITAEMLSNNVAVLAEPIGAAAGLADRVEQLRDTVDVVIDSLRASEARSGKPLG